jgi:hypothetical protein
MIRSCTGRTPGAAERKIFKTEGFALLGPFLWNLRRLVRLGTGRVSEREGSLSHLSSSQRIWKPLRAPGLGAAGSVLRSPLESPAFELPAQMFFGSFLPQEKNYRRTAPFLPRGTQSTQGIRSRGLKRAQETPILPWSGLLPLIRNKEVPLCESGKERSEAAGFKPEEREIFLLSCLQKPLCRNMAVAYRRHFV